MKKYLLGLAVICVILSASIAFADTVPFDYYDVDLTPDGIFKGKDRPAESVVGQEIKGIFRGKTGVTVTNMTASVKTPDGNDLSIPVVIAGDKKSATMSYTPQKVGMHIVTITASLSVNGQSASGNEQFAFNITEGGGSGCDAGFGIGALFLLSALWSVRKGKKK